MRLTNLISHPVTLIGSAMVLLSVLAVFYFSDHQIPDPTKLFTIKPGVLEFTLPEKILTNQPFLVNISVDTKNQSANAVGVYLRFDPNMLKLLDLDTSQSFCQLYPEKKYDNLMGVINLACGSPHPGVSGKNTLLSLKFMPIVTGVTTITVDPKSQILLSNGKGTNILTSFPKLPINILNNL